MRPLSSSMRKVLTGYVVNFNKRHNRHGHLFQNRYKSIVCEEDVYLMELVRYIHLNLIRAGMVKSIKELNRSPWSEKRNCEFPRGIFLVSSEGVGVFRSGSCPISGRHDLMCYEGGFIRRRAKG